MEDVSRKEVPSTDQLICSAKLETYMNMAPQASRKTCSLDRLYTHPNGPFTGSFLSVWNALFKATVASEDGQSAELGYTMKRLASPARPYPQKLIPIVASN